MKKYYFLLLCIVVPLFSGEWVNGPMMQVARAGASSVVFENEIYVFGGKTNDNQVLKSVEVYNPLLQTWDTTRVAPFNIPRYNATAIIQYGQIFLIGGRDNNSVLKSVERYNREENEWELVDELDKAREGHSAHILNGKMFALGGQKEIYDLVDDIEWYNWDEEDWQESAFEMDSPRSAFFSASWKDTVYIFGGFQYGRIKSCYKAAPDSGDENWISCGQLSEPRAYGASVVFDSLVFMFGGETEQGKTTKVETYNFLSGEIKAGESMPMPHSGMTAAVLEDEIFVLGGFEGPENRIVRHNHVYRPLATALNDKKTQTIPGGFELLPAFPNPFNGQSVIRVDIKQGADFTISVYDYNGRKTAQLFKGPLAPGGHEFRWNATQNGVASGLYFIRVQSGTSQQTQKLLYVK